ncbi:MAG: hypothetical protein HC866_00205 [Leptolyngbyaceae cyanobacterium RU_5_1]|nr:hypothetical protein [Leptolyngbyaceae cyanobacterium RU_5_1]
MLAWIGRTVVIGAIVCTGLPVSAQTCVPLPVVGGTGTEVRKTISIPSIGPLARSNWDTGFTVSGGPYSNYVARITPRSEGNYAVQLNLKYSNNLVDKVFDENVELTRKQPLKITVPPRSSENPVQIDLSVGGGEVVGNTYTLSVEGCR